MNAYLYIKQKQVQWAKRRGIQLKGSQGARGERAYTPRLGQNLFRPLSPQARAEYESGKGGELAENEAGICKMQAVHSSAALAVNIFQYWRQFGQFDPVLKALDLRPDPNAALTYEKRLPIADKINRREFPVDPHIDIHIACPTFSLGIECKFTEAYSSYKHAGLKPAYMKKRCLWPQIPGCEKLAQSILNNDSLYPHLQPAQLIKHILGLKNAHKNRTDFLLVYLWYDVPFDAGYEHRKEIECFAKSVYADGIAFRALTYQELILRLAENQQPEHRDYIDYLTERYL